MTVKYFSFDKIVVKRVLQSKPERTESRELDGRLF